MTLTVAICTRDRCSLLDKTLARMTEALPLTGFDWEVLVVDNGSSDSTQEVARRYQGQIPLRVVTEHRPGLSNARNCAVASAAGQYIVWTDDDVLVGDRWLAEYAAATKRFPDAAFFGGPIFPWFEGTAPKWITESWSVIHSAFAARDLGEECFQIDQTRLPFGANYVVRTDWQRQFLYNNALGRTPGQKWIGGEEIDVLQRIIDAGGVGWWIPTATVKHWIPRDRQTYRYVRRYFSGQGRLRNLEESAQGRFTVLGVPTWLIRSWLLAEMRLIVSRALHPPETWSRAMVAAAVLAGELSAVREARRTANQL